MPQIHRDRMGRLREFIAIVDQKDWTLETPEQPVQIIQKSAGTPEFGTAVVSSPDVSIAPYWAPHPALSPLSRSSSKCSTNASQTRCTPHNSSSLKKCCLRKSFANDETTYSELRERAAMALAISKPVACHSTNPLNTIFRC